MEQFIISYIKPLKCIYVKIDNESDLLVIYDLFKNNIPGTNYNSIICLYHGLYYEHLKKYDLMKKYYLMAVDYNNYAAMYNLACYYENNEINYDLMKKYYLMAINCGDSNGNAANDLAYYYSRVEINYDLMKKYYLMAIKKGNDYATSLYKLYHKNIYSESNINDIIYLYYIVGKQQDNYDIITKGFNKNHTINNHHMTDYIQSMNTSVLLSKYNNICVGIKQIFLNWKQIMLLLYTINRFVYDMPINIKLNIISLLFTT